LLAVTHSQYSISAAFGIRKKNLKLYKFRISTITHILGYDLQMLAKNGQKYAKLDCMYMNSAHIEPISEL